MLIQLCGPPLPPPKLNFERSAPPPPETRAASASRRAADVIASIDEAIGPGREPCPYCQSDLYEEHPPGPCPGLRQVRTAGEARRPPTAGCAHRILRGTNPGRPVNTPAG